MQHPVACRDIHWLQADMPERAPIGKFTCFFETQFTPENQFETRKSTRLEFKMWCQIARIGGGGRVLHGRAPDEKHAGMMPLGQWTEVARSHQE